MVERLHPTVAAKQMARSSGIEAVLRQVRLALYQAKVLRSNNQVYEAHASADGTIASGHLNWRFNLELVPYPLAVTAAAKFSFHFSPVRGLRPDCY